MTTIDNIMALADQYMGWGCASDRQALRAAIETALKMEQLNYAGCMEDLKEAEANGDNLSPTDEVDCPRCGHCCPDDTALLRQALDALENHTAIKHPQQRYYREAAIAALRERLDHGKR